MVLIRRHGGPAPVAASDCMFARLFGEWMAIASPRKVHEDGIEEGCGTGGARPGGRLFVWITRGWRP
jgi:hypothetical protein